MVVIRVRDSPDTLVLTGIVDDLIFDPNVKTLIDSTKVKWVTFVSGSASQIIRLLDSGTPCVEVQVLGTPTKEQLQWLDGYSEIVSYNHWSICKSKYAIYARAAKYNRTPPLIYIEDVDPQLHYRASRLYAHIGEQRNLNNLVSTCSNLVINPIAQYRSHALLEMLHDKTYNHVIIHNREPGRLTEIIKNLVISKLTMLGISNKAWGILQTMKASEIQFMCTCNDDIGELLANPNLKSLRMINKPQGNFTKCRHLVKYQGPYHPDLDRIVLANRERLGSNRRCRPRVI